jgi:hypothetical protein
MASVNHFSATVHQRYRSAITTPATHEKRAAHRAPPYYIKLCLHIYIAIFQTFCTTIFAQNALLTEKLVFPRGNWRLGGPFLGGNRSEEASDDSPVHCNDSPANCLIFALPDRNIATISGRGLGPKGRFMDRCFGSRGVSHWAAPTPQLSAHRSDRGDAAIERWKPHSCESFFKWKILDCCLTKQVYRWYLLCRM